MLLQEDPVGTEQPDATQVIERSATPPPLVAALTPATLESVGTPAALTASTRLVTPAAPLGTPPAGVELPPPPGTPPVMSAAPPVEIQSAVAVAAAPPITGTRMGSGPAYVSEKCKYHPKTPGRFRCNKCNQAYCELCVATRSEAGVFKKFCRQCAGECVPVKVVIQQAAAAPAFYKNVPGAFFYPFKGMGIVFLVFLTLFLAAAPLAQGFRLYLQIIIGGYLFAYIQTIIQSTAMGEGDEPSLPDITNFADDIVLPFFQLLGTVVFSFGPAIALFLWAALGEFPPAAIAGIPAAILGCIYLPMALLAVAMLDTIGAVNPLLVIPSILKVIKPYTVTVCIICAVALFQWLSVTALDYFFGAKVNTKDMTAFLMKIVGIVVCQAISVYLLTVNARLLGLLFLSKKSELGWFSR